MEDAVEAEVARPRELLPPLMLLLLAEAPSHGYELMERLRPLGFDWNGPGPIYRELRTLEAAELVTSEWEVGRTGPGRRVYRVTPAGRASLERATAGIGGLQALIAQYLARFGKLSRPSPSPSRRRAPKASPADARTVLRRTGRRDPQSA